MYIENKKVIIIGTSLGITIKPNAGLMLQKGERVKVTYTENKIIIERVK